jgi:Damage-control phosphatase ARMT1-like domain
VHCLRHFTHCHFAHNSASSDVFAETLAQGSANLLADDQERVTAALQAARSSGGARVDIVVDNAGFELFCDLCLADYLVTCGAASVVVSAMLHDYSTHML